MNTENPILDAWPNCAMPDCGNKCCTWSRTVYCFPHAEELIGREELICRYNASHERPWDAPDDGTPNYMLPEHMWRVK
jgi:hypothetical protein